MATAPPKLMTADEFWDFVHRRENQDRVFELVRGEVVEMTKPGKRHGFVCINAGVLLHAYATRRKKGYVCGNDTGVVVARDPDSVRGPDLLFFEDATSYEQIDKKWGDTPPRLAVEVMSPNDTMGEMNERIQEQLDLGTPLVWLIDPESRSVTVYRPGKNLYVRKGDEELTGEDVLPDFRCKVSDFFRLPGQEESTSTQP
jgi:Uma2 family endonuclease